MRAVGTSGMRKTPEEQLTGVAAGLAVEREMTGGFRRIRKLESDGVPHGVQILGKEAHLQRER